LLVKASALEESGMLATHWRAIPRAVRDWTQFCIIVLGALWGVYTFLYKEIVVPGRRPATLVVKPSLQALGYRGTLALVRARLEVANRSDTRVWVPALWYHALGVQLAVEPLSAAMFHDSVKQYAGVVGDGEDEFRMVSRYSRETASAVVATWKDPVQHMWFDPGDEVIYEQLFYVPAAWDVICLEVDYYTAKDGDAVSRVVWRADPDGSVRPALYLRANRVAGRAAPDEEYRGWVDPAYPSHKRWAIRHGVGETSARATLVLRGTAAAEREESVRLARARSP